MTARGPVEPHELGRVLMHEHLHADNYDWDKGKLITEEKPILQERRELLMQEAVPYLKQCNDYGCSAFVDATPPPMRAWPTFYAEVSEAANMHIILCTGCYCELTVGEYWAKTPTDRIWPFVVDAPVEEIAEYFTREIVDGIHGTNVRTGAIKLGVWKSKMTDLERKCHIAGARAQKATGVHITTHCWTLGAETDELRVLADEGVDLDRVVLGHTAEHLMDPECRKVCIEWMRRGANFLPTNLGIGENGGEKWRPLVEAIHEIFDAGLGEKISFGLDWAFVSESKPFAACTYLPPPPYAHMFTHTLPAFRKMGLTPEEENAIMLENPQRILPVRKP